MGGGAGRHPQGDHTALKMRGLHVLPGFGQECDQVMEGMFSQKQYRFDLVEQNIRC